MNPVEQARQYLDDHGKTLWSDADIRPMVEGLLEICEAMSDANVLLADSLNVRMADIRSEGPNLLQSVKNWWRNR
jgi:hypothetical protein